MINKIIKIKGVGKFENYVAKGDISFVKNNIVYAENGFGKTTLTSILSSLKSNSSEQIIKRKTIGCSTQEIEILVDKKIYSFENGKWSQLINNFEIEIFDTFFVNENIFSGFDFSASHRKNLYQFVLGEESIKLNNEIANIKNNIERQNKELGVIQNKIEEQINNYDFPSFLKLQKDNNIDLKIANKEKEYNFAKEYKNATENDALYEILIRNVKIKTEDLQSIINSSVETISSEFLNLVEKQVDKIKNKIPDTKNWIKDGVLFLQETESENCPFCNQNITDNKLIIAYQQYFNEKYKTALSKLDNFKNNLLDLKTSLNNTELLLVHTKNQHNLEYWNRYFENKKTIKNLPATLDLLQITDSVIELINKKQTNLLLSLPSNEIQQFQSKLFSFYNELTNYNSDLKIINSEIEELKQRNKQIEELEKELIHLKAIELRYSTSMISLCNEYKRIWIALRDNNEEKAKKQKLLYDFSTSQINKYGEKINYYLNKFNSPFSIKKIRSGYSGASKQASVNYSIYFKNNELSNNESDDITIKYSLSEGDKSTIAFSFFLAKLELSDNLEEKVIIIDDPISSFDKNRRNKTINIIGTLSQKIKQSIILTHNQNFCFDLFINNVFAPKAFRIDFAGDLREYVEIQKDIDDTNLIFSKI